MTKPPPEPFDVQKILGRTDSLGRHIRRFAKIKGSASDPEFALHLRAAEYAITQHCVGAATTPWAKAMQAYEPTTLSGKEARQHWNSYQRALENLAHALAGAYQDRNQGEKEISIKHANILHFWEDVADEIAYFSATRHDLSTRHPLPNRDAFSSAIEWFFEDAMATLESPPEAIRPKAPTKTGELRRGSATIMQLMEEAAATRRAEPPPARSLLTVRIPKPEAEHVRHAIAMVEDPAIGISWYETLLNAVTTRGKLIRTEMSGELSTVLLSALEHAGVELDHALTNYTSVLRHNFHHPTDIKEDAHAFAALNEAVQHLITQLPGDKDRLPDKAQFAALEEAMKHAALTTLTTRDTGYNSPSKRNGGGAGGFPGGRR